MVFVINCGAAPSSSFTARRLINLCLRARVLIVLTRHSRRRLVELVSCTLVPRAPRRDRRPAEPCLHKPSKFI